MKPGVIDAEVVPDLVDNRYAYFVDHVVLRIANLAYRISVDLNTVGQDCGVPVTALCEGDPGVQAQQVGFGRIIDDRDDDIAHHPRQTWRNRVQRLGYELLELLPRNLDHSYHSAPLVG